MGKVAIGLTWVAIALWVIAQALPAFAIVADDFICSAWPPESLLATCDMPGILVTLFGWAMLFEDVFGGVAWTANVFFGLALVARWAGRPAAATVFALAALACGLLGVAVLVGGVGEAVDEMRIRSVGIGSWVWVASLVTLAIGVSGWAFATVSTTVQTPDMGERRRELVTRIAVGLAALVGVYALGMVIWPVVLETKLLAPASPAATPTPVPGTIQVSRYRLPAPVRFDGGVYRVEACAGDQVLVDGEPRGTPPLEIVIDAGQHEVDGELRRCSITFIPVGNP